ncbi:Uncharacterized protein Fot_02488 [Forsythia ovata]|uniref:Uncharacterized protein n=1 Tax=Forsythia ovata TaxID=205694 RepID=A0ABD1X775_9LAMI
MEDQSSSSSTMEDQSSSSSTNTETGAAIFQNSPLPLPSPETKMTGWNHPLTEKGAPTAPKIQTAMLRCRFMWKLARQQRANLKEPARYNGGDTLRQVRRRAVAIVDYHIHIKNTLLFLLLPQSLHVRFTSKDVQSLLC